MTFCFDPKNYSEDKLQAVMHEKGPMLVLAVAGSGKTYAITHRIAHLTEVCGVEPPRIVAVSFTNKAARELRERVAKLIGKEKAKLCQLSTFHAMGLEILRKHLDKLGWKSPFAIFGDDDQRRILKEVCKDIHFTGPASDPENLMHFISKVKTHHCDPLELLPSWNPRRLTYKKIFDDYQSIRKSMNGVDFDDMIALPVELFERFPDILKQYEDAWHYLMVDEYQDTNSLQFRMIQLLCSHRDNIMVVGDDDQAIYAFRGAESEHILNFPNLFENVKVVKLEYNFRSTRFILEAANGVIQKNQKRHPKTLKTESGDGERVRAFACPSPEDEATFVVEQLEDLRTAKNLHYKDIAILYRANAQSNLIEEACIRKSVPYRIVGGSKFYDHAEIRDLVFYMRTALSPMDELALRRIINTPRRGIAAAALEHIDRTSREKHISFFDALKEEAKGSNLLATSRLKLTEFIQTIESFHRRFVEKKEPMATTMQELIDAIHFKEWIQSSSSSDVQARIRTDNIRELLNALALFERTEGRDLMGVLEKICIEPPQQKNEDPNADVVTLMTLHSSKGLEFPAVFIVGCEENLLPHANALDPPNPDALAEERRLFYVGMTRAKKFLTLTRSKTRHKLYQTDNSAPSRFLDDIPDNCIEFNEAESEAAKTLRKETEAIAAEGFARLRALLNS